MSCVKWMSMDPNSQQDSPFIFFAKRLEYVPRYMVDYFFGLLAAIVSDVIITTIALAAIALGLAIGHWLLVVAFFFTLYALLRIVGIVANAIGNSGQLIANSMYSPNPPGQVFAPPMMGGPSGPQPETEERIPVTLPAA